MIRLAAAAALSVVLHACSLLAPLEQCGSDADCAQGETCTRDGLCSLCGDPDPEPRDGTVLLGAIQTLSGPTDTTTNEAHENAIRLAVDRINVSGALGGRSISLVQCDTGGDNTRAPRAARDLVDHHGVAAILGLEFSSVVRELGQLSTDRQVVLMSHWATSEELRDFHRRSGKPSLIWRTVPDDSHQAVALARLAGSACIDRLAVAYVDDDYGRGLMSGFEQAYCQGRGDEECLAEHKLRLADPYEEIEQARSDAEQAVEELERRPDVQALALIAYKEHSEAVADAMFRTGSYLPVLAVEDALDPAVLELPAFRNLVEETAVLGVTPGRSRGRCYREFSGAFKSRHPEGRIPPFSAHAYDSMMLLGLAAGAIPEGEPVTGPALADALARLSDGEEYGPGRFWDAVQALRDGKTPGIDYVGASGELQLVAAYGDPEGGELGDLLVTRDPDTRRATLCDAVDVGLHCPTQQTPRCRDETEDPDAADPCPQAP